ncbi:MAG: YibE/F family protein [Clostridiaceae bacterium]|nr:YibE/F family protein [Clostridiaceae bacterium]
MRRKIHKTFFIVFVFTIVFFMMASSFSYSDEEVPAEASVAKVRGKVSHILDSRDEDIKYSGGSIENSFQIVEIEITTDGPYKGKSVETEYSLSMSFSEKIEDVLLKPGDEVLMVLELDEAGEISRSYIYSVVRDKHLLLLVIIFSAIILSVGRLKGLKALISLILTVLAVIYVLLPLILHGFDPVFVSLWICVGIAGITLLLVGGYNKKTLAALIGTSGGLICAGFIAQVVGEMAKLTGLGDEESQMLMYIPQNISFDYKGLLFAGILIGALGAAMDVGMSLSSAMFEIKEINPGIKKGDLLKAGMNIGRDMIGTMSNTLILAYTGGALQLMLLLMAHEISFIDIINQDGYAAEVVRSLAGSIGLILTIPITAMAVCFLCENRYREKERY